MEVAPNPAQGFVQVNLDQTLHPEYLEIYNTLGQRMIYSDMVQHQQNIDLSRLSQGIYVIKVKTEEGIGTKRIVVDR